MNRASFVRLSFLAAALGGTLWSVAVLIVASRPPSPTLGDDLGGLLFACLLLFMLPSLGHALSGSGSAGGSRIVAGAAAFVTGLGSLTVLATLMFWGLDTPEEVWGVTYLGFVVMCAGYALTGLDSVRSPALRWPGLFLTASAVVVPFANSSAEQVWLWLPLGLAWLVYGLVRLAGPLRAAAPRPS